MMISTVKYLGEQFYTLEELLAWTKCSKAQLRQWQELGCMPRASYCVNIGLELESCFGEHDDAQEIEYYAKGYVAWIGNLQSMLVEDESMGNAAFDLFAHRYEERFSLLFEAGLRPQYFCDTDGELDMGALASHLESEWKRFLDGVYGACTRTGLPEDIADKELAVRLIDEVTEHQTKPRLSPAELSVVARGVELLDLASSSFAPHERSRSSRTTCVEKVRLRYPLGLARFAPPTRTRISGAANLTGPIGSSGAGGGLVVNSVEKLVDDLAMGLATKSTSCGGTSSVATRSGIPVPLGATKLPDRASSVLQPISLLG